jgi:hypothetical protein
LPFMLAEYGYCKVVTFVPDPGFVGFVAKIQKAKTRKNKDYYILRTTVPKEVAEKIRVEPGEFLFFKAKKAEWYHMLDWEAMENTWKMLPPEIQSKVAMDGLYGQGISSQQMQQSIGATNLSLPPPMIETQTNQVGDNRGSGF